jgi:hypothetical protein
VEADLLPFYASGISEALMDATYDERSLASARRVPGLPLCLRGGRLFVVDGAEQSLNRTWPWQAANLAAYAHVSSTARAAMH